MKPVDRIVPCRTRRALMAAVVLATLPLFGANVATPPAPPSTQPTTRRTPGSAMDRAVDGGSQVYVDDSFASVERIRKADAFQRKDDQWQLAVQTYQEIINDFGQKLVYLDDGSYMSITDYVRERLLAMPAVQRGDYDQFFGVPAQKEIDAAIQAQDLSALIRACDKYFPATASVKGLSRAAEWYFERGEFPAAARTWQLLLTHPRAKDKAQYLHRALVAEKLSGRLAVARKLRDRLERDYPDATGIVDGKEVNLVQNADEMLKLPAWREAALPADEWPTFQGSNARTALADVNSQAGAKLWGVVLDENAGKPGRPKPRAVNRAINPYTGEANVDLGPANSSFPVMSGGQLFIDTGERILAISQGTIVWSYPAQVPSRPEVNPNYGYNPYGYRTPQHDSCSVYGDQVFAVLPANNRTNPGYNPYGLTNTRLVALDKSSGKELWSTSAGAIPVMAKPADKAVNAPVYAFSLAFLGSPLVTRQGVFALARRTGGDTFAQLYLVRLDRESGAITWQCYLCSTSTGGYYGYGATQLKSVPLPAMADDIIYISTGQGADCAVDANAGRILWLQTTEAAKPAAIDPNYGYQPQPSAPAWKYNAPLIYKDKLVTMETGAWLRIYDRWTGKLLSKIEPKKKTDGTGMDNVDILAGIQGSSLILVGRNRVVGLDLDTGKNAFVPVSLPSGQDIGSLAGRPFLTQKMLYLPMQKGLAMLDLEQARTATDEAPAKPVFNAWPKNESDVPGGKDEPGKPGNLLVTSEQVIVVNDDRVVAYARWETARDNRLAEIRKDPSNPKPYLDLAEVAYRTLHWDIAEENMRKSVELATAAEAPAASREILPRLYRTNLSFAEQLLGKPETADRDRSRFYFEQCRACARDAETNAEWRLAMAPLSLAQKNYEEAASLYNDVLTDRAMRVAPFRRGDNVTRAGVTAEANFRALIARLGREATGLEEPKNARDTEANLAAIDKAGRARIYQRYEDQAAALLGKARVAKDTAQLANIVESYPNSFTAIAAAHDLAAAQKAKQDYEEQIKTLRWAYQHVTLAEDRARLAIDLAESHAALKRWNSALSWVDRGRRHAPNLKWTANGQAMSFAKLREEIHARVPNLTETRRASLTVPLDDKSVQDENGAAKATAAGTLLVPLETAAAARRPDLMLVAQSGKIHAYGAPNFAEKWTCELDDNAPALLVGYANNMAVVATASKVYGIDVASGDAWKLELTTDPEDVSRANEQAQRLRNIISQQNQMMGQFNNNVVMAGDGDWSFPANAASNPYGNPYGYQYGLGFTDADQARAAQFLHVLGRPAFTTMRMLGNKLVVIQGNHMFAVNIASGKRAWSNPVALPDGLASVVTGNDEFIVAQVDAADRAASTLVVLNADKGTAHATIKLDDERVLWRAVAEDGTLFLVSDQAVTSYNLHTDPASPAARTTNRMQVKYPAATALTLDGLLLVNGMNELVCLSQDSLQPRWQTRLQVSSPPITTGPFIRTLVDGDNIILVSGRSAIAYRAADGEHLWTTATGNYEDLPPLVSAQMGARYLVMLGYGQVGNTPLAASLVIVDPIDPATGECRNGSLAGKTPKPLVRREGTREAPVIRNWQLLDGGVALDIGANVYVYRSGKPN